MLALRNKLLRSRELEDTKQGDIFTEVANHLYSDMLRTQLGLSVPLAATRSVAVLVEGIVGLVLED